MKQKGAENQNSSIITVRDLTVRFGDNLVLKDVSFDVARGEVLIVAGGSGCGKSTLLKHMLGLYVPAAGEVSIDGVSPFSTDDKKLLRMRRGIGVLFQSGALLGSYTILENVMLPITEYTPLSAARARDLARLKLAMVGLAGYENHLPSEVSGGMMKRAGLARAMALDPTVLFFDEPSAGLDPVTSAGLDQLILSINRGLGTTMVIVTHELPSIFTIGDRVLLLDRDKRGIRAEGPPGDLRDKSDDRAVTEFFNRQAADMTGVH